jgi:ADP-ribose pyrophosphatase YjhB (NUDIX family)
MSKTIPCVSIYGNIVEVPVEKLGLRVASYGVLREGDKLLMVKDKWAKKWEFPGGGIKIEETVEEAVCREFEEETGLIVKTLKLIKFTDGWLYQDDKDRAFHTFRFFFEVEKVGGEINFKGNDTDVSEVSWIKIEDIKPENVKTDVFEVMNVFLKS